MGHSWVPWGVLQTGWSSGCLIQCLWLLNGLCDLVSYVLKFRGQQMSVKSQHDCTYEVESKESNIVVKGCCSTWLGAKPAAASVSPAPQSPACRFLTVICQKQIPAGLSSGHPGSSTCSQSQECVCTRVVFPDVWPSLLRKSNLS